VGRGLGGALGLILLLMRHRKPLLSEPMVVSAIPSANDRKKHAAMPMVMAVCCNQQWN
jgi:hypothetical protein